MLQKAIILFLGVLLVSSGFSQELIEEGETQILHKKEQVFGLSVQSAGIIGINFRKGVQKTVSLRNYWELEIANLQHPKEFSDPRFDFIFKPGKINTVWALRATYGQQRELAEKLFSGVGLKWTYLGGASIAMAKPIFVSATHSHVHGAGQQHDEVIEPYDPLEHSIGNVQTKESFFMGIGDAKYYPGVFIKTGLQFEYSPYKDKIRAIELGVSADYYLKEVPIMASVSNDNANLHWALYVNFLWGKKW